jgi:hypothetical protein
MTPQKPSTREQDPTRRDFLAGMFAAGTAVAALSSFPAAAFAEEAVAGPRDLATPSVDADGGTATTTGAPDQRSLITDISTIYAAELSAGVKIGAFEFSAAQPAKIIGGSAGLNVPVSQNDDGSLNWESRRLSLQNNPAMQYGVKYSRGNYAFGAEYDGAELLMMMRVKKSI